MKPELRSEEVDPEAAGVDLSALAAFASTQGPLAIVDLETTGLASDSRAEILEFGIVLVSAGQQTLTTLSGLVRPSHPIPLAIQRLTGLRDEDVAGAPSLDEVSGSVAEILSGRTIIAHNADFERGFLTRFVDEQLGDNSYLDTQDLLALTHPDASDLRLESFTRALLGTEERHRALEDALDTLRVMSRVAEGAQAGVSRCVTARRALDRYAPESAWAALLGKGLGTATQEPSSHFVEVGASSETPVPFDEQAIVAALSDAERGARHFPGYRVRAEQIELARHFVRNLSEGGRLLLEGGTGVGKSLAYLAAAIPFAMQRAAGGDREPVVVSTRTKLLQDQLLDKDIAAAARMLGYPELRALSMKGRANYVCERRIEAVLLEGREPSIFAEDRLAYAVLLCCSQTRRFGEIGALPAALQRRYPALRELVRRSVAARAEQCSREDCARHQECALGRRRAALGRAHLVVANHDLLLRWPPDYPTFRHAIVDEAHELAGVADEVYAQTVSPDEVIERLDEIFGRPSQRAGSKSDGLLPAALRRTARKDALSFRRAIHQDLSAIGHELADRASDYGEVHLPEHADRIFSEAAELAGVAAGRIEQAADEATSLCDAGAVDEDVASAIEKNAAELRECASGLRTAFRAAPDEAVAAFERVVPPFDRWRLSIRAISPAAAFHEQFLQRLEAFSAVSASLFVAGDAFAALGELEIDAGSDAPGTAISVPSPFPYASQMRALALDPDGDLVEETAAVIAQLARLLGGRTLGLFTSLRRMHQVAEILSRDLRDEGFDVLAPRRAGDDPTSLVDRFCRSKGGGVLLGARTFWQGLDIPGPALQAVVIEKLPFEVPTELRKRRADRIRAAGQNAFERYGLGKMLLHLKQMTGRLIRTEEDRGLVVIVEGRTDRRYFASLRQAFPPGCEVRAARSSDLAGALAEIGLGNSVGPNPQDRDTGLR